MPMVFSMLTRLARVRITVMYSGALVAVTIVMLMLGPFMQGEVMVRASTNLHNLAHGHLGTLLGSAFVVDAGPIYVWLPGLVCLLAVCEIIFCSTRLILAFAVGHIGATLLVAAGLTVALKEELLSASITRATDVGMSYGAIGVLGGLTTAIPRRWRPDRQGFHQRRARHRAGAGDGGVDTIRAARRVDPVPSGTTGRRVCVRVPGADRCDGSGRDDRQRPRCVRRPAMSAAGP
jgi:hypothetical protein